MVEINEADALLYRKSVRLLVSSMQEVSASLKQDPAERKADEILRYFASSDYVEDADTLALTYALDPENLLVCGSGLARLLNHLKLDLKQLEFAERIIGLDQIKVRRVAPEGKRAFCPIAKFGGDVDFNRLYVHGDVLPTYPTIDEQRRYLGESLGRYPDGADRINSMNANHFNFNGVGEHPLAHVYVLLRIADFRSELQSLV